MALEEKNWFGIPREEIKWFPKIDYDKCNGCMVCMQKCTHKVYAEENGKPIAINPNNCVVGCTGCDKVCPEKAISHPPKEYLEKLTKNKNFKFGCDCSSENEKKSKNSCNSGCNCGGK
jgi:NAD-dependent dihydropyrimidine dehydrogenase PreA subunit